MNKIRWPCENLPLRKTVRWRLYEGGRHLLQTPLALAIIATGLIVPPSGPGLVLLLGALVLALNLPNRHRIDFRIASRAFDQWRLRWAAAEEASAALAAAQPTDVEQCFNELPPAPPLTRPRDKFTQKTLIDLSSEMRPDPHLPSDALEEEVNRTLAHIAWAFVRLEEDAVVLRTGPNRIALYVQAAPCLHYWAHVMAVPGSWAVELTDGIEFWIPEGSRAPDMPGGYRGERQAFEPPKSAFWHAFKLSWLRSQGHLSGPTKNALTSELRQHGLFPEAGDSLDLAAIYAARPAPIAPDHVTTEAGTPLFPAVTLRVQLLRQRASHVISSLQRSPRIHRRPPATR